MADHRSVWVGVARHGGCRVSRAMCAHSVSSAVSNGHSATGLPTVSSPVSMAYLWAKATSVRRQPRGRDAASGGLGTSSLCADRVRPAQGLLHSTCLSGEYGFQRKIWTKRKKYTVVCEEEEIIANNRWHQIGLSGKERCGHMALRRGEPYLVSWLSHLLQLWERVHRWMECSPAAQLVWTGHLCRAFGMGQEHWDKRRSGLLHLLVV